MSWTYPTLIAHRCGGALAPENTLAGLHIAARLGVKAVEFDAMLCADGVPVLIHDDTVDRTSNGHGDVPSHTLADLQQLDAGRFHHKAFAGEHIPTLAAALDHCNALGLAVNLEIKPFPGTDRATALAVIDVLQQHPVAAGVLLSSFSTDALRVARDLAPAVPRALLVVDVPADWLEQMRELGCLALHCAASHVTESLVQATQALGYPLACYTVNDRHQAEQLYLMGVAALFSDRPDLFLK